MRLNVSGVVTGCISSNFVLRSTLVAFLIAWQLAKLNGQLVQNNGDDFEINVERAPYSLKFSITNTDNYELENVTCKTINTIDQFENEENICENLLPCTNYRATLSIKDLTSGEVFTRDSYNATTFTEPTVTLISIEPSTDNILLTWTTTDNSCILKHTIQCHAPGVIIENLANNTQHEFLIDNLSPCMEYVIVIQTYDVNDNLVSYINKTEETEYAEPGNVTNIVINTEYENGHAKVTWDEPSNKTCIDFYYLKWFTWDCDLQNREMHMNILGSEDISTESPNEAASCEWSTKISDQNKLEYIIKGLDGCETYGLQMFINDEVNAKSEVKQFISAEGTPDQVILELPDINPKNVTLHWSPPQTNTKCVKEYEIMVNGPMQNEVPHHQDTKTRDIYADFDNLVPCGLYEYNVTTISLNGTRGITVSSKFETLEDEPSVVLNPVVVSNPYSFNISWEEPAYANFCIDNYRLVIWINGKNLEEAHSETLKGTSANVTGLIACQSYTIQITAITKGREDGKPCQIERETAAAIVQPPENFQFTDRYSDGIELSTRSNDVNNTCDTIFARFKCIPNSSGELMKKSAERNVEGKVGGTSFKALLSPLSPYTEYSCFASFFNIAGWSAEKQIVVSTLSYYSETPKKISLKSSTHSTLVFNWEPPLYPNGNINVYMAHFQRVRSEYYVPPDCPVLDSEIINRPSTTREMKFDNLHPFTRYSIQVAAENDYGVSEYTRPFMVVTNPSISDPVKNVKTIPQGPYESDEGYQANVLISWMAPCRSNGEIESFDLNFLGQRGEQEHRFNYSVDPNFDENGIVMHNETNLKPDFGYTVSIVVRNFDVERTSAEQSGNFFAPAGIPKRFNESTISKARVDASEAPNPTNSAVVRFPAYILESDSGSVIYAAILISEKGCNSPPNLLYGAINAYEEWPESRNWKDVYTHSGNDCIIQYQTTDKRWQPEPKLGSDVIEFTVGTASCENANNRYCNGPLKPDTEFYLVIRLFTRSGYNDAAVLHFRTDSLVQLKIILISVSCCLAFAFIAGFVYIYIRKRMLWKRQSYHDIEDPFGDIMAKNFAKYYNEISRPEKLSREFKELTMVAMDFSYSASELGRSKNRYSDIYPYDKNRVILDIDADGSDYINASFINGYRRKKEYIATQGPKPESTLDFWRMVLQHNIRVIVMVTQFREGDKVKCHEYFPYKSMGINVTVKKKDSFELYDRSEMSVTHDRYGLKQKVIHFYFKKWPDHGCPDDPMQLITFVRKVKAEKVPSYSSIVVHCSAGVGRTGTFIGLDILMQRIKSESKINIYGTVKKLRFQRMKMVQSLEQYTFLYKCAYELVKHKNQRARTKSEMQQNGFQEDPEANPTSSSLSSPPARTLNRSIATDLTSIAENELEYNENSNRNSYRLNGKPYLSTAKNPSPSTSNGVSSHPLGPQNTNMSLDRISLKESTM